MTETKVLLFGRFSIHRAGQRVDGCGGGTTKDRAILAHLALSRGRFVARDTLATTFWGDMSQASARRALSTALWRLRQRLAKVSPDAAGLIQSEGDGVRFAIEKAEVDVLRFLDALEVAQLEQSSAADAELDRSLSLVRGVFLEGLYDEWTLVQRTFLEGRRQTALELLARAHESAHRYDQAVAMAASVLENDPLHEPMHRVTIRCHLARGNPAAAIRQYLRCTDSLLSELAVHPTDATTALVANLIAAKLEFISAAPRKQLRPARQDVLNLLK